MAKLTHEFRDPIHTFVRADNYERHVIDSEPVQRLRNIHQLSMSYLVYPAATHRRFEHSLGVMDLAGRVYDVVTSDIDPRVRDGLREAQAPDELAYWRRVLRAAGLCHDIGHLPFSHAAEKEVLPEEWDHERLTNELIFSSVMEAEWKRQRPTLVAGDIARLATGPKSTKEPLTNWQAILSEIITGSAFGVDRIDYLLRDSLHCGVAYGRFDHYRLIDALRILPPPPVQSDEEGTQSREPQLGVEAGGLQSAEALLLARYFMYSQVYLHRVRRVFDLHFQEFLRIFAKDTFPGETFPVDPEEHLKWTDAEITSAMLAAARDPKASGHDPARRIVHRDPFKLLWQRNPQDIHENLNAGEVIFHAATNEFGRDAIRRDYDPQKSSSIDFPVRLADSSIVSAQSMSDVLRNLPSVGADFIFVRPDLREEANDWLSQHKAHILQEQPGEEE